MHFASNYSFDEKQKRRERSFLLLNHQLRTDRGRAFAFETGGGVVRCFDVTRDGKHFFPAISSALGPRHDLRTALWRVFQRVLFTGYSNLFHPLEKGERLSGNAETMRASRLKGSSFSDTSRRAMIPPPRPPPSPVFAFMRARVRRPVNTTRATLSSGQVFRHFFFSSLPFVFLQPLGQRESEIGRILNFIFYANFSFSQASLSFAFSRKIIRSN